MITFCYAKHPVTGKTVMIKRGIEGFFPCQHGYEDIPPDILNKQIGVTEEQVGKMLVGSTVGWDVLGAQGIDEME